MNPENSREKTETYGFKTNKYPSRVEEIKEFEDDVIDIIANIETKQASNNVLTELKEDVEKIEKQTEMLVSADKTSNLYLVEAEDYLL